MEVHWWLGGHKESVEIRKVFVSASIKYPLFPKNVSQIHRGTCLNKRVEGVLPN